MAGKPKPRIHIVYTKERSSPQSDDLPWVTGVLSDLSGNVESSEQKAPAERREFMTLKRGQGVDPLMQKVKPKLRLEIQGEGAEAGDVIPFELDFESISHFTPDSIAERWGRTSRLLAARQKIVDWRARLNVDKDLQEAMKSLLGNDRMVDAVIEKFGGGPDDASDDEAGASKKGGGANETGRE